MRLTKTVFLSQWERILRRFGLKMDGETLAKTDDYFAFLCACLTSEEFLLAAQVVWATAKWFPRPADFLTVGVSAEWRQALGMAQHGCSMGEYQSLTKQARLACEACGGLGGMAEVTNIPQLREAWTDAYAQETYALASGAGLLLAAGDEVALLTENPNGIPTKGGGFYVGG